ncbi:hypothetical protein JWG45_04960, partial [Leptospira sp. 201903070]
KNNEKTIQQWVVGNSMMDFWKSLRLGELRITPSIRIQLSFANTVGVTTMNFSDNLRLRELRIPSLAQK